LAGRADRRRPGGAGRDLRRRRRLHVRQPAPGPEDPGPSAPGAGPGTRCEHRCPGTGPAALMGVRVGVDVGGTFTKAVALDGDARVVARSVVPTTHTHPDGVAAGVVQVVGRIAEELAGAGGADAIELVTHSTTQAVNALLEGDVVPV